MEEYGGFGVSYYWLLDPALGSLEIFELQSGRWVRVLAAVEGTIHRVPGCDGLALDLDELWAELRRLSAEGGA
jgi:Uma2 family endonuclease